MYVKDVMSNKVHYFKEDQTISIIDILDMDKIRNIAVVNSEFKLVGLVTYRELLVALASRVGNIKVKDIMIEEVTTVAPHTPLKGAIDIMIANRYGCLPVVDNERNLTGILTEKELLQELFDMVELPDYESQLYEAVL